MKLEIDLSTDPKEFVRHWSGHYKPIDRKKDKKYYCGNINRGLCDWDSFHSLFIWKNVICGLSEKKLDRVKKFWLQIDVLRELKREFDWELFESEFKPSKCAAIWKIFLLHIIDPKEFPIFDVHVYRFHQFISCGRATELPDNHKFKYDYYRKEYLSFFTELRDEYSLDPKKMDEAFFACGRSLQAS